MAPPDDRYEILLQAAGNVSRETFDRLLQFEARFRQWNARINLASASTLDELWTRHIVDSAQLLKLSPNADQWLDIGSGGGFPGIVLALLLQQGRITLVESNRKKAGFLSAMVGEFSLPAEVLAVRIEDAPAHVQRADIVTARALASLPLLLGLAAPWLTSGTRGLFHKGRDYRAEVAESARLWQFDLVEHVSVTDEQAVILQVDQLRPAKRAGEG